MQNKKLKEYQKHFKLLDKKRRDGLFKHAIEMMRQFSKEIGPKNFINLCRSIESVQEMAVYSKVDLRSESDLDQFFTYLETGVCNLGFFNSIQRSLCTEKKEIGQK